MRMTRFISTLAVLAYLAGSAAAFAQKGKASSEASCPKTCVKARPGQGTLKNAASVKGKEEQEISAPKPTSAKLPEVNVTKT